MATNGRGGAAAQRRRTLSKSRHRRLVDRSLIEAKGAGRERDCAKRKMGRRPRWQTHGTLGVENGSRLLVHENGPSTQRVPVLVQVAAAFPFAFANLLTIPIALAGFFHIADFRRRWRRARDIHNQLLRVLASSRPTEA